MEIRSKLGASQGMWPAIWMLPTDSVYGGWPSMMVNAEPDGQLTVKLDSGWPNLGEK